MSSIRASIRSALKTALQGIDGTGSYNYDFGSRVYTRIRNLAGNEQYPAMNLRFGVVRFEVDATSLYHKFLPFEIEAVHKVVETDGDNGEAAVDAMLEDIERALTADATLGGTCVDCLIQEGEDALDDTSPLVQVLVRGEIKYRTTFANPAEAR